MEPFSICKRNNSRNSQSNMDACFVTSKSFPATVEKLFPLLGSRISYSTRRRLFVSQFHQLKKVGTPLSVTCKYPVSCFLRFAFRWYFRVGLMKQSSDRETTIQFVMFKSTELDLGRSLRVQLLCIHEKKKKFQVYTYNKITLILSN